MSDPSGIAGEIHTPRKIRSATQTGLENRKSVFVQLRCLVYGNNIVFLTLISQNVSVACAEAEKYATAVFKAHCLFGIGIIKDTAVFPKEGNNVVGLKLRESPSYKETANGGIAQTHSDQLSPQRPGLTASSCSAVCRKPCSGVEELLLLGVGLAFYKNYSLFIRFILRRQGCRAQNDSSPLFFPRAFPPRRSSVFAF